MTHRLLARGTSVNFRIRPMLNRFVLSIVIFLNIVTVNASLAIDKTEYLIPIYSLLLEDASLPIEHLYAYNDGPDKNPMKGWNTGWWNEGRDEASVGFQYIAWKEFEPDNNVFNRENIEQIIDRPGTRNRHVILRLYCDWHGEEDPDEGNGRSSGCPEWLYNDVGIKHITGLNGRKLTDYNNPKYIEQAEQAIAKLAEWFDGDPRIYVFQIGILGYWGEWHTSGSEVDSDEYPTNPYTGGYVISDESEDDVLIAYRNNFSTTRLMARYPWGRAFTNINDIGFHNDFFMPDDGHSLEFDLEISTNGQWRNNPIGGEAPPEFKESQREAVFETSQGMQMITTGHYSTMQLDQPEDPAQLQQYMVLHRKMGYNFQIESALFAERVKQNTNIDISLTLANIGVAPFYYNWRVEYALLDQDDLPVITSEAHTYDLTSVMPEESSIIEGQISTSDLVKGQYRIAIRLIQNGAQLDKSEPWALLARNTYIVLSNELPVIDGSWNANNALVGGWSILGNILVD